RYCDEECGWAADTGTKYRALGCKRCSGGATLLSTAGCGGCCFHWTDNASSYTVSKRGSRIRGECWARTQRVGCHECGACIELPGQWWDPYRTGLCLRGTGHLAAHSG